MSTDVYPSTKATKEKLGEIVSADEADAIASSMMQFRPTPSRDEDSGWKT